MRAWPRALVALSIVLPLVAGSIHSVCNLYFDCGCVPIWAGGIAHCNIQVAGPPDCPWCRADRFVWVALALLSGSAAGVALGTRISRRVTVPVLLGLVAYGLTSFVVSWL